MCTVSIVPRAEGFRLVCNRDEKRTRPTAMPPAVHRTSATRAMWPVDPSSGGTWIGANDAGVAMVLLNRTPARGDHGHRAVRSRGTIIPRLLCHRSLWDAIESAGQLPSREFEPFALLVLHGRCIALLTNEGGRMAWRADHLIRPIVFTSSSLGDDLVFAPRRALFARMVEGQPASRLLRAQAAFHHHRWRSRPAVSVVMTRPDAATVSRTILDVDSYTARMRYRPVTEPT